MFGTFLQKRAASREYKQTFDDCLLLLFCGFPSELLSSLRQQVDVDGMMRVGQSNGSTARECAVEVATHLIGNISLNDAERQAAIQAFQQHEPSNSIYKGFNYMFQVVEQLGVNPLLISHMSAQVEGHLQGLSRETIHAAWMERKVHEVAEAAQCGSGS